MILEKSIERIIKTEPVKAKDIEYNRIAALGFHKNPANLLIEKEHQTPDVAALRLYMGDSIFYALELFLEPQVSAEDYLRIVDGSKGTRNFRISSEKTLYLTAQRTKPSKKLTERINDCFNLQKTKSEKKSQNISFSIYQHQGKNEEKEFWLNDDIIPIYQGDENYQAIMQAIVANERK